MPIADGLEVGISQARELKSESFRNLEKGKRLLLWGLIASVCSNTSSDITPVTWDLEAC